MNALKLKKDYLYCIKEIKNTKELDYTEIYFIDDQIEQAKFDLENFNPKSVENFNEIKARSEFLEWLKNRKNNLNL